MATTLGKALPYPTRTTRMAKGLRDLYRRLQADAQEVQAGGTSRMDPAAAADGAQKVADVLALLGQPVDPARDTPKRTNAKRLQLPQGAVPRRVLEQLRLSGDWRTAEQMVGPIATKIGLDADKPTRMKLLAAIRTACSRFEYQGHITRGPAGTWRLANRYLAVLNRR